MRSVFVLVHTPSFDLIPRIVKLQVAGSICTRLLDRTGLTDLQHQIVIPFALDIDMRRCAEE